MVSQALNYLMEVNVAMVWGNLAYSGLMYSVKNRFHGGPGAWAAH